MKPPATTCPDCGEPSSVTFTREEEYFFYGVSPHTIKLTAVVDKGRCAACLFEFTDWRGEEARDRAVQDYLKRGSSNQAYPFDTQGVRK